MGELYLLYRIRRAHNSSVVQLQVYQRALQLLGDVLHHVSEPTDPPLDTFLDVIRSMLEWPQTDERTRDAAISALTHATYVNR